MNRRTSLILLLPLALLSSGFTWGLGKEDGCSEIRKSLAGITPETPAPERDALLKRAGARCPEGGAAVYLRGLTLESEKKADEAIAAYRSAAAKEPGLAEAHGRLGLLLLAKGELEPASVELISALQQQATPAYARAAGDLFLQSKLYALALYFHRQALPAFAGDPTLQLALGWDLLGLGATPQATVPFQEALRLDPGAPAAHLGLAACYRQEKRYQEAAAQLRLALAAQGSNRETHFQLAQVLELAGNTAEAEREYRLAGVERTLEPEDYQEKAARFAATGNYDQAAAAYQALLLKEPGAAGVRGKLGDARMSAGHDLEAIQAYEEAIQRGEGNSGISYNLGILYERKGSLDDAVSSFQDAVQLDPANGDARRRLAEIHTLRGSIAEAIEQYQELISRHDTNPLSYFKLGRLLERQRDFPGAAQAFAKAAELDGNNVEARRALAFLLLKKKLPGDPAKELGEVLRLRPKDQEARYALIALQVKAKRYDETAQLLKEDAELNPESPESHYRLGVLYAFRHQDEEALASFQETVRLKPDHARALKALGALYLKAGEREKSKAAFQAAHQADPQLKEPVELSTRLVPESARKVAVQRKKARPRPKRAGKTAGKQYRHDKGR
jgi:tetratricopeptide (TPR) repeat protein